MVFHRNDLVMQNHYMGQVTFFVSALFRAMLVPILFSNPKSPSFTFLFLLPVTSQSNSKSSIFYFWTEQYCIQSCCVVNCQLNLTIMTTFIKCLCTLKFVINQLLFFCFVLFFIINLPSTHFRILDKKYLCNCFVFSSNLFRPGFSHSFTTFLNSHIILLIAVLMNEYQNLVGNTIQSTFFHKQLYLFLS